MCVYLCCGGEKSYFITKEMRVDLVLVLPIVVVDPSCGETHESEGEKGCNRCEIGKKTKGKIRKTCCSFVVAVLLALWDACFSWLAGSWWCVWLLGRSC